jgi:hypothetical protein
MADRIKYPSKQFMLPVVPHAPARLVESNTDDFTKPSTKGYQGKVLETPSYYYAFAISKSDPTIAGILTEIMNHAWTSSALLPNALERIRQCDIYTPPPSIKGQKALYAWKISDGDAPHRRGRDGQAGCWIFKFTTAFMVNYYNAANGQMTEADIRAIKLGDYGRISFAVEINGRQDDQAGLFLNPHSIRIERSGERIIRGPDAETVFGAPIVSAMPASAAGGTPNFAAPQQAPVAAPTPAFNPPVQAPSTTNGVQASSNEAWAAQHSVPHYAGHRFNPATRGYDPAPEAPALSNEAWAAQHSVPHYAGHRFNPATRGYDPAPEPVAAPAPTPAFTPPAAASVPAVQAPATAPVARGIIPPPSPATVSPSSAPSFTPPATVGGAPSFTPPPGVTPHPSFTTGG